MDQEVKELKKVSHTQRVAALKNAAGKKIKKRKPLSFAEYYAYFGVDACAALCEKVGTKMSLFYHLRLGYKVPSVRLAKLFIEHGDGHFSLDSIFADNAK